MTAKRSEITKTVDIRGFGIPEQVPIEFNQDVAPEDELLENLDLNADSSQVSEPWNCALLISEFGTFKIYCNVPWVRFVPTL